MCSGITRWLLLSNNTEQVDAIEALKNIDGCQQLEGLLATPQAREESIQGLVAVFGASRANQGCALTTATLLAPLGLA